MIHFDFSTVNVCGYPVKANTRLALGGVSSMCVYWVSGFVGRRSASFCADATSSGGALPFAPAETTRNRRRCGMELPAHPGATWEAIEVKGSARRRSMHQKLDPIGVGQQKRMLRGVDDIEVGAAIVVMNGHAVQRGDDQGQHLGLAVDRKDKLRAEIDRGGSVDDPPELAFAGLHRLD